MRATYVRRTQPEPALAGSIALLLDALHVRPCAAHSHLISGGSGVSANHISLDVSEISSFLDRFVVEFELKTATDTRNERPRRWIYDTVAAYRRQRWRVPHYRTVINAERFVVKTIRVPRPARNHWRAGDPEELSTAVDATLASDLLRLAAGESTTVVLLAGGDQCASSVWAARELGASVVLLIPAGCGALVGEALRAAVTRVIALHVEVFAAFFQIRELGRTRQGRPARTSLRYASNQS